MALASSGMAVPSIGGHGRNWLRKIVDRSIQKKQNHGSDRKKRKNFKKVPEKVLP